MPIKKDGAGRRWVEMELVVPGTPEQVWDAIATGAGYAAWFTPTEIEEREGGAIRFDFGSMGSSAGEVTTWEPPHRFAYVEREWSEGAPPVATEITVETRSGDQCVIRMVHSLFTSSDDWDDQVEGFEKGWPGFFAVLRLYLTHFAGQKAAQVSGATSTKQDALAAWKRLIHAIGLAGADVGEERRDLPEKGAGVLEVVRQDGEQRYVIVRMTRPAPGLLLAGTYATQGRTRVSVIAYSYGADGATPYDGSFWQRWLDATIGAV